MCIWTRVCCLLSCIFTYVYDSHTMYFSHVARTTHHAPRKVHDFNSLNKNQHSTRESKYFVRLFAVNTFICIKKTCRFLDTIDANIKAVFRMVFHLLVIIVSAIFSLLLLTKATYRTLHSFHYAVKMCEVVLL